jgi:hypothetical protein
MDCLQTKCILIAHNITKCRLTAYFACIQIANLAHSHQLVVGPERSAVDKLRAMEVLVLNVKADLNLRTIATAPPNLTFRELIVPSVGYRQPEPE